MEDISSFLEKFKLLLRSSSFEREMVSGALFDVLGVKIDTKNITLKNGFVYLQVPPVLKSEIVMRKIQILGKLGERGIKNIKDIK